MKKLSEQVSLEFVFMFEESIRSDDFHIYDDSCTSNREHYFELQQLLKMSSWRDTSYTIFFFKSGKQENCANCWNRQCGI